MESLTVAELIHPEPPPFTWISTTKDFHAMIEVLCRSRRMAIDIEADSLYHYFEKVCLIQISTDRETYIHDPLAINDLTLLRPMMASPEVEKVFHAAGYDVFCLRRDHGFAFSNIFDTHIAGQLIGYEFLGLSALLEKLLGIAHSKRRQRDDWSQRPLKAEQLEYAAMDTHHLLRLRDILEKQLCDKGRLEWAQEEFEAIASVEQEVREFDPEGFRRIKGSRDLEPNQLAVLRALYLMREVCAREMNVPPFKVLNNPILIDLVLRPPRAARDLFQRPGFSYRVARRYGKEIMQTIRSAGTESSATNHLPAARPWKPPSADVKQRLERLKTWRNAKASELNLPIGVIFPGNLLESISVAPPADLMAMANLQGMRRWRVREFGEEILRIL